LNYKGDFIVLLMLPRNYFDFENRFFASMCYKSDFIE